MAHKQQKQTPEQQRADFEEKMRYHHLRQDVRWMMHDHRGRRFIARFLATNGEDITSYDTSFTGNSTTFELEGRRKAAKQLQALLLRLEPEAFLLLLRENFINQEIQDDRRDGDDRTD